MKNQRIGWLIGLIIGCNILSAQAVLPVIIYPKSFTKLFLLDEEYEKYKKQGDDLFTKGEYEKANKKYLACLEVPGFADDAYAKNKIEQCKEAVRLKKSAEEAFNQHKEAEAVENLKQLLIINPADANAKKQLAEYLEKAANQKYEEKQYEEAKALYEEAIKYADKKQLLVLQIQNSEEKIKSSSTSIIPSGVPAKTIEPAQKEIQKSIIPEEKKLAEEPFNKPIASQKDVDLQLPKKSHVPIKIVAATIGIATGTYAYLLNSQFTTKVTSLNNITKSFDPTGSGIIANQASFNQWQAAYNDAQNAQNKQGIFYACVGLATGAVLLEAFLLVHKPKKVKELSIKPSSTSIGGALLLAF